MSWQKKAPLASRTWQRPARVVPGISDLRFQISKFWLHGMAQPAISRRRSGESFSALALPPFKPPSRPSATAAGFFFVCAITNSSHNGAADRS